MKPTSSFALRVLGLTALALVACSTMPHTGRTPALPIPEHWIVAAPGITLVEQQGRSDCGSAALSMVLEHVDPKVTPALVRGEVGHTNDQGGVEAGLLRDVARERGLDAFLIEGTFADLESELRHGRPVLVGLVREKLGTNYPHFAVVAGIDPDDGRILLADPAQGWSQQSFTDFLQSWQPAHHLALVVMPKALVDVSVR